MRGTLEDAGLGALLRGLVADAATGSLAITGPTGPAQIFLRDGAVSWATSPAPRAQLGARLVGAGFLDDDELAQALEQQAATHPRPKLGDLLVAEGTVSPDVVRVFVQEQVFDALFEIATWDTGAYEFSPGDRVADDLPVALPVGHVVAEIERRLAEWATLVEVVPSLQAVPDFAASGGSAQAALEPDEFTILTNVDGRRTVRELALDLGYSEFETARLVYGLAVLGVLEVRAGEDGAAPGGPAFRDDVAAALEDALFGSYDEFAAPPTEPDVEPEPFAAPIEAPGPTAEPERSPVEASDPEPAVSQGAPVSDNALLSADDDIEPPVWSYIIEPDDVETPDTPADRGPAATAEHGAEASVADAAEPGPPPAPVDEQREARRELSALSTELGDLGAADVEEAPAPVEEPAAAEPQAPAASAPEPAAPAEPAAPVEPAAAEPAAAEPAAAEPAAAQGGGDRGQVAEFLRELSMLAGDEDDAPRPSAPPPPPPGSSGPPPSTPKAEPPSPTPKREEPSKGSGDKSGDKSAGDKGGGLRRLFGR